MNQHFFLEFGILIIFYYQFPIQAIKCNISELENTQELKYKVETISQLLCENNLLQFLANMKILMLSLYF